MLKKLLWKNKDTFFNNTFEHHEVCRYSFADFFYSDVKKLAEEHGVNTCYAGILERYKIFGENCFVIISAPNMKKKQELPEYDTPILFNPETLMI